MPPRTVPAGAWLDAGPFARAAAPSSRADVTLLDPGAAPRAPLRYVAPAVAAHVERRLRVSFRQDYSPGGASTLTVAPPPWSMSVAMTAPEAADAPWRYHIGRIEMQAGDAATNARIFRDVFAGWIPVEGELALDARGAPTAATRPMFTGHTSIRANEPIRLLDDVFDAWLVVFPTEPVGVGARWRIIDSVVRGGFTLARTRTFTLVAPARVVAQVALDVPRDQRVNLVVDGASFTLTMAYWKVTIDAEINLDPTSLLPRRATAKYHLVFLQREEQVEGHTAARPSNLDLSAELN